MCFKYKFVYTSCTEEMVTHPFNALTNLLLTHCSHTPPENIKPMLVALMARRICFMNTA